MKKLILFSILAAALIGCTQNQRARHFGGTETIKLPPGMRLETATWKGEHTDLWYVLRPLRTNEVPETHEFVESSNFGVLNGKVIFVESR